MWSGKTTRIAEITKERGFQAVEPDENTRGSERDLAQIMPGVVKFSEVDARKPGFVFDEVHLYEAFDKTEAFVDFFHYLRHQGKDIALAGVSYDCYNGYRLFPIWRKLLPCCDEIHWLVSMRRCHLCDAPGASAEYSMSLGGQVVGDDYVNVCKNCLPAGPNM